ncbi:hypothetical protein [Rhizobium sp. SG2393]|uniref:hypothetical protein n=1 Tax=Rhizobium sp. SG2393 TaxID=3276279 RepID=UPI00366BF2B7
MQPEIQVERARSQQGSSVFRGPQPLSRIDGGRHAVGMMPDSRDAASRDDQAIPGALSSDIDFGVAVVCHLRKMMWGVTAHA